MIKLLRINEGYDIDDDSHTVAITCEMVSGDNKRAVMKCMPSTMLLEPKLLASALRVLANDLEANAQG